MSSKYTGRIKRIQRTLPNSDNEVILVVERPPAEGGNTYICNGKEYTQAKYEAAFPDWPEHKEVTFIIDDLRHAGGNA